MAVTAATSAAAPIPAGLPLRIKILYITTLHRRTQWLADAFAADGAAQMALEEVIGVTAGVARLRDEAFDAVLVSHEPGILDAVEFAEAYRGGGGEEPLIVLGHEMPQDLEALCFEAGADDYCCATETTVRGLLWKFARAIQRFNLTRENRRLLQAERQRLQQEHHEAERLLEQQRALVSDLEMLRDGGDEVAASPDHRIHACLAATTAEARADVATSLPAALVDHYRELLRAYVIMGAGNLAEEMTRLAELLAAAGVSAHGAVQLHVAVLEELVEGLGNRSARHVMNRADLLVLEVVGRLADGYRQRYYERRHPPRQRVLPGFDVGPQGDSDIRLAA